MGRLAGMDDYDMLLEYLLDPEEELAPQKQAVSKMDSSLSVQEATRVMLAKLQLRPATRQTVLMAIQMAFTHGWMNGKAHKGKHTPAMVAAASEAYLEPLKGL